MDFSRLLSVPYTPSMRRTAVAAFDNNDVSRDATPSIVEHNSVDKLTDEIISRTLRDITSPREADVVSPLFADRDQNAVIRNGLPIQNGIKQSRIQTVPTFKRIHTRLNHTPDEQSAVNKWSRGNDVADGDALPESGLTSASLTIKPQAPADNKTDDISPSADTRTSSSRILSRDAEMPFRAHQRNGDKVLMAERVGYLPTPGELSSLANVKHVPLLSVLGDNRVIMQYVALGLIALYAYKSIKEDGVDIGNGKRRNIFTWVDVALAAIIAFLIIYGASRLY